MGEVKGEYYISIAYSKIGVDCVCVCVCVGGGGGGGGEGGDDVFQQ